MIVRFPLGQVVATPGALALFESCETSPLVLLARHVAGDWGDLCANDREQNELSVDAGLRILSAYALGGGERLWIITEADRFEGTIRAVRRSRGIWDSGRDGEGCVPRIKY